MSDIVTNYPGVRKIVRFQFAKAPTDCELYAMGGNPVICPYSKKIVSFHGMPVLTSTTKVENNGTICEMELSFKTNEDLPFMGWIYAVQLEDERGFLIGTDERQPLVSKSFTSGTPDGDPKVNTFKITYKGAIGPIECII